MSTPHDRQIVAEFWIESRRTKKLERALQTKERAPEVLRLLGDPVITKTRPGFHFIDDLRALDGGRRRLPRRLQLHSAGADFVVIGLRGRRGPDVPSSRIAVWRRWRPGLVCKYGRCGDPECPRDEGHRARVPECSLYNGHHHLLLTGYGETSWCLDINLEIGLAVPARSGNFSVRNPRRGSLAGSLFLSLGKFYKLIREIHPA